MTDPRERFLEALQKEMTITLATASGGRVTMRSVSPVPYDGGVLIFTAPASLKYRQLKENPLCCVSVAGIFAECRAKFPGATMLPENAALRDAYAAKFPGAFDEGIAFGGRDAHFLLLRPTRLSGWTFANDGPRDFPTVPFEVTLTD